MPNASNAAIQKKIKHLIEKEGKSPKQAAGMAYGMAKEGRLTPSGGYKPKKKKK